MFMLIPVVILLKRCALIYLSAAANFLSQFIGGTGILAKK